jgi:hypothetical protein
LGHSRQICESKFINLKLREEKLGKNSTAPIIINPIVNETSSTSNLNTNNISKQSIPQFRTFRPFNNNDMKGELGCAIEYQSNRRISLRDVWFRMNNQKLGSDPNGTIQQRWGFCQQPNTSCPKY